jgi:phage-related protein
MTWNVEFFSDDGGRRPVREWLGSLDKAKRNAAIAAIEIQLAELGLDVCASEHGRQLGGGLFEFRIRHDEQVIRRKAGGRGGSGSEKVLLRIFCHAYGEKIILLLGAYDKGADPSPRRQQREINTARRRLRSFKLGRQREAVGRRRRG